MARPEVPDASEVRDRWSDRTPQAAEDFAQRASESADKWLEGAQRGQGNYEEQMQKSEVLQRRAERLDETARDKFRQRLQEFGASRFRQGVQISAEDFRSGVEPILNAIANTDLTERGPAMSEANFERVREVARAANEASMQG